LQELEAEIDASMAEIEEVKDKIKKAKIAHRKILNSKDQSETALKIVARNLEGAQEDEDAGSIKEFCNNSPPRKRNCRLKSSRSI